MKKYLGCLLVTGALFAFVANAQAGNAGTSANVTGSTGGFASSTGNSSVTIVGVNTGVATALGISAPGTTVATTSTVDTSTTQTHVHVTNGAAIGGVSANGHASANAWTTP